MVTRQNRIRHPHLECRQGIWTLRVRVPEDVRLRVGLSEVRRSLKTRSFEQAQQLAARHVSRLKDLFDLAHDTTLSGAEIQALAQNYFKNLAPQAAMFRPTTSEPSLERREQAAFADEEIADLRRQIVAHSFDGLVLRAVGEALHGSGIEASDLPASELNNVAHAIARAMIEHLPTGASLADVLELKPITKVSVSYAMACSPWADAKR